MLNPHSALDRFINDSLSQLNKKVIKGNPLEHVLRRKMPSKNGLWLEFGVYSGQTIKQIARFTRAEIIYGFDSFMGLPEAWGEGHEKGHFSRRGQIPKVPKHVKLIKGWFKDTLPQFAKQHKGDLITLMHIDCDIYSSTKCVFDNLSHLIAPRCVVVFDELIDYPAFKEHEIKAFYEYLRQSKRSFEYICRSTGPWHCKVAVQMGKRKTVV